MTEIEWTDRTWNPVRGCTRVSPGCVNCYAERMCARRLPGLSSPTTGEPFARMSKSGPRWTGAVEFLPHKLAEPLGWRKPARVFVNSMSDLFHEDLRFEQIAAVFGVMAACPHLTFQVLTKRPERALKWFRWAAVFDPAGHPAWTVGRIAGDWFVVPAEEHEQTAPGRVIMEPAMPGREHVFRDEPAWPLPNVWLGVSAEDQQRADERIPLLLQIPAAVRFVSYEPALGPVDFRTIMYRGNCGACRGRGTCGVCEGGTVGRSAIDRLDWIIVGGESGPGARPCSVDWVRSTVRQCRDADVPVFVKQFGARPLSLRLRDPKGGDPSEWPADLRVREFPCTEGR